MSAFEDLVGGECGDPQMSSRDELSPQSPIESFLKIADNPDMLVMNGTIYDRRDPGHISRQTSDGMSSSGVVQDDLAPSPKRRRLNSDCGADPSTTTDACIGTTRPPLRTHSHVQASVRTSLVGLCTDVSASNPGYFPPSPVSRADRGVSPVSFGPSPETTASITSLEERLSEAEKRISSLLQENSLLREERERKEKAPKTVASASSDDRGSDDDEEDEEVSDALAARGLSLASFYGVLDRRECYRRTVPSPPGSIGNLEDEMSFEQWKRSVNSQEVSLGGRKSSEFVCDEDSTSCRFDSGDLEEVDEGFLGGKEGSVESPRRIRKRTSTVEAAALQEESSLSSPSSSESDDDGLSSGPLRRCHKCRQSLRGHPRVGHHLYHLGDDIPAGMRVTGNVSRRVSLAPSKVSRVPSSESEEEDEDEEDDSDEDSEEQQMIEDRGTTKEDDKSLDLFDENMLRDPIEEKRRMLSLSESESSSRIRPVQFQEESSIIQANDCPICLDALGPDTFSLVCCHVFHLRCISRTLSSYNTRKECPKCQFPVTPDVMKRIESEVRGQERDHRRMTREEKKVIAQIKKSSSEGSQSPTTGNIDDDLD